MKPLLFSICLLCSFSSSYSQETTSTGTEFWLAYMENLDLLFNPSPQFSIYISANEAGEGTVRVEATGLEFEFEYAANQVTEFTLPTGIYYAEESESVANIGLKISTNTDVQLYAVHYRPFFSESSLVLPVESLGNEYVISAAIDFNNNLDAASSFVIVATEDDTSVEIIPSQNTLGLRPKDVPFTVDLNAGNSYQVQALDDLSGSVVRSLTGQKIAIFSGAQRANIGCSIADNHVYDQLFDISHWGSEYAFVPFAGQSGSIFKIVALEDATDIFLDNDFVTSLNASEVLELDLEEASLMKASNPVQCTQYSKSFNCSGNNLGDPNMLTLQPLEYRIKDCHFPNLDGFEFSPQAFSQQYVQLICPTDKTEWVNLDNESIDWKVFSSDLDYSYAQVSLNEGFTHLSALEGVQAYAYGFGEYDAYSYNLGFDQGTNTTSTLALNPFSVNIGPNPATQELKVHSSETIETYQIWTIQGSLLHTESVQQNRFLVDLQNMQPGQYILELQSNERRSHHSFTKL